MQRLRRALEPLIRRLLHFYWRFSRAATLGARAMVIDGSGPHLPGPALLCGGLAISRAAGWKRARRSSCALARELAEEGNIVMTAPPLLHGLFFNKRASRRDHVAFYIVRDFRQDGPPVPNHEIVAHGFFAPDALPEGTSRATRARIAEVFDGVAVSELW